MKKKMKIPCSKLLPLLAPRPHPSLFILQSPNNEMRLGRDEFGLKVFNCLSACIFAKEIWDKLLLNHEGKDKVKETKVDILTAKYEKFKMISGEFISKMYGRFTYITKGLATQVPRQQR
ncbi:hypothetical protein Taro_049351 [Colocasia esculenta]|uniref:Uncharacterized protein n=1 Tax=Colocasia esculenta TaxID=4460 RepID=A0A843XAJ1_COLES|nr:hypothetical protein [Colocasia esculenta]